MDKCVTKRTGPNIFLHEHTDRNTLDPGIYRLVPPSIEAPIHLTDFTPFVMPEKVYGQPLEYLTNKVLNTFKTLNKSVGVLLSGLKGTGKSLQLKHIAMNCNMPVVIINSEINGKLLIDFFEKVPASCVVLFDEFEKVYSNEGQESILPLLDGLCSTPHIYVFTVNEDVSQYMISRPSRIRYNKKYDGLDESIIYEIAQDLLIDKGKIKDVVDCFSMLKDVNMDMVVSLLQDINIYPKESVRDILRTFNLEDPLDGEFDFVITTQGIVIDSKVVSHEDQKKIYKFYEENVGCIDYAGQIINKDVLYENLKRMQLVVDNFPGVSIKNISGEIRNWSFNEFCNHVNGNDNLYLDKHYSEEVSQSDVVIKRLAPDYLQLVANNITLSKNGKKIDVLNNGIKIATAKKSFSGNSFKFSM